MRKVTGMAGALAVLWSGAALAEGLSVGGHEITVTDDGMGSATLVVDGQPMHENGVIFLDEAVQTLGGVTVVTGVAGAGGNACGAAPFVLALPEGAAPVFHGPVDSCRELTLQVQPDALIFSAEPLPAEPGEIWVWNPITGLTEALPEEFTADEGRGWEDLPSLAATHPADALKLAPVLLALQSGLGADYPVFAERISDLGSGDLTAEGYLGSACLKLTCEDDWAVLYLHRDSQQVFAAWHVYGEAEARIYPQDTSIWPPEAMEFLRMSAMQ